MAHDASSAALQPLLHDAVIALRAPAQAWSRPDGSMGDSAIDGVYVSDLRLVDELRMTVAGVPAEHIATTTLDASRVRFTTLHRALDDVRVADPDVRGELEREVTVDGARHVFTLVSRLEREVTTTIEIDIRVAVTPMDVVKAGGERVAAHELQVTSDGILWRAGSVTGRISAPDAAVALEGDLVSLSWSTTVPPRGSVSVEFSIEGTDADAVVAPAPRTVPWARPDLSGSDDRLTRWVDRALDDLDGLRLVRLGENDQFFAAGAPWFFTLFGRDSLWAARFLLPLGTDMAEGTLRVLAGLQGRTAVAATAEQPGKIMHELRRGSQNFTGEGLSLPPLYFGTVDATPLWVCLLVDAWRAGLPDATVRELLPTLVGCLEWMRDFGDSDGDGLLEYVDETGSGLSNQGWKDSGDSVQWRDGRLADGPIALAEVQAYAYEAAMGGAELLDAFGGASDVESAPGDEWRAWAARLSGRFRETFWVRHPGGDYPAIALDAAKRPVDSLTSNLGHLLGTGLLDADESRAVAARLVSPELDSGFGLRTMSTAEAGYWPLSYHGGSVWTHDTAIAVRGLALAGLDVEAAVLSEGLLAAAPFFDYRMPELHSGDARASSGAPVPYPAACRPQAWSAAAAIVVWDALRP